MASHRGALAFICLGLAGLRPASAYLCRQDWKAAGAHCGLPDVLSNFQGYFACNSSVQIGRPTNLEQLVDLVKSYDRVKASGVGHSWWREQFCSGDDDSAINIVLTEMWQTALLTDAPRLANVQQVLQKADFPIQVDEDRRLVRVKGGVTTRILLDYLANYVHAKEPRGWVLPSFPWYLDQTIAGAVATGTHGSDFKQGTLPENVVSLTIILANGTLLTLTPESNPHLFKAAKVSVGRLGIIEELTFQIVPQMAVERTVRHETALDFAAEVTAVQEAWKAAKTDAERSAALQPLSETQVFIFPAYHQVLRTDYRKLPNVTGLLDVLDNKEYVKSFIDKDGKFRPEGAYEQGVNKPMPPQPLTELFSSTLWLLALQIGFTPLIYPGVFSSRNAYVSEVDWASKFMADLDPYDQYELAIPMEVAGTCLKLVEEATVKEGLGDGFRVPGLIRFVGGGDSYIGHNTGGPVMYVNVEDHLSHTTGTPNIPFEKYVRVLHNPPCNGRLHYGKAGWPWLQPCFEGADVYGVGWCDFGCAVQDLDPTGKFRSESAIWHWDATRAGAPVPFGSCCTPEGFDRASCACVPSARKGTCPTDLNIPMVDIKP